MPPLNELSLCCSPKYVRFCSSSSWFHGKITREQAERLLYPPETGLFLVRESTNYPGDYTLCVSCDGKVEHYRIIYHNGKLTIDEEEYFENLMQLVEVSKSFCLLFSHPLEHLSTVNSLRRRPLGGVSVEASV